MINRQSGNWNIKFSIIYFVALVVCLPATAGTGGLALVLPAILGVIEISDIIHSFDHNKSNPISQLMTNPEISKNYSNILMEQQLLMEQLHLIYYYRLVFSLLILSYIQKIYLLLIVVIYLNTNSIIFIRIIIYFISVIIPQTSCYKIVVAIF